MAERKKRGKPLRKRQEIKRDQIRRRALARKVKIITTFAVLITIAALVVVFYPWSQNQDNTDNETPSNNNHGENGGNNIGTEEGQEGPDFELMDTDGVIFALSDYRGNVVVLDFMATWCGPCEDEFEHLKMIRSDYDSSDVKILSIDVDNDESSEQLRDFKDEHGCDWSFNPYGGDVGVTYNVESIPAIFIIDKQGTIAYKNVGLTDYTVLESEIDKLL